MKGAVQNGTILKSKSNLSHQRVLGLDIQDYSSNSLRPRLIKLTFHLKPAMMAVGASTAAIDSHEGGRRNGASFNRKMVTVLWVERVMCTGGLCNDLLRYGLSCPQVFLCNRCNVHGPKEAQVALTSH